MELPNYLNSSKKKFLLSKKIKFYLQFYYNKALMSTLTTISIGVYLK